MKLMRCKLLWATAVLVLGVMSCKEDAVFDQNNYNNLVISSFPVENVDPNQDWATVGTAWAEVSVNLDYDVTYDVGLYLDNPIGSAQATRVCERKVKSGESFSTAFSYKLASPVVYVGVFDPQGRGLAQAVKIENGRAVANINTNSVTSARHRASEDASVYGQYVKTYNDYLNPSVSGYTTKQITIAGMQAYEAFTDADIDSQHHIFGTASSAPKRGKRRAGESVSGSYYYKPAVGDNPANGDVTYIYANGLAIGKVEFGGTGTAAVASDQSDYPAKIYRPYFKFTPLTTGANVYIAQESRASAGVKLVVVDETEGSTKVNSQVWQRDLYMGVTAGHTYKIYSSDNQPLGLYGIKAEVWGTVVDDPNAGGSGSGGESGGGTPYTKGDGHHYRVAAGTEITKVFNLTGTFGVYNDIVVYVEGKLHLNGNTLNAMTLVVANGGEVIIDGNTQMTTTGRFVVLAGGKISGANGVTYNITNGAPCYNAGTINFSGELNLNGCDFYNSADGTVNVTALHNTSGGQFINFGKIEAVTNTIAGDAYNCHIVNGCYMKFTGDAGIGGITMLDNSRLDVGGQLFATGREANGQGRNNTLYNLSSISASTIKFRAATFVGPTANGEFAVVKTAKEVVDYANTLNSYNNVYWDINRSAFYDYDNNLLDPDNIWGAPWHIMNGGAWCDSGMTHYVTESTAPNNISIPAGQCTGVGYNPNGNQGGGKPEPVDLSMRFMFEDNYPDAGDYDLNDCVFSVTPVLDSEDPTKVTVTVRVEASGATKAIGAAIRLVGVNTAMLTDYQCTQAFPTPPSNVGSYENIPDGQFATSQDPNDGTSLVMLLFKDIHWVLNPALSETGIVQRYFYNTQKPEYSNYALAEAKTATYVFQFANATDAQRLLDQSTYDAFIVVPYNGSYWEVHTVQNGYKGALVLHYAIHRDTYQEYLNAYVRSASGNIPWAVMVPATVAYPYEWVKINTAYPEFTGWAQDHTTNTDWYSHPVAGEVWPY